MTRAEWEALVEYTLNIGRQMMECGAEAWRAENTMARIFRAYGLEVLDAHVIATQAAVTVKTPTGEHYTSTCMILPRGSSSMAMEISLTRGSGCKMAKSHLAVRSLSGVRI